MRRSTCLIPILAPRAYSIRWAALNTECSRSAIDAERLADHDGCVRSVRLFRRGRAALRRAVERERDADGVHGRDSIARYAENARPGPAAQSALHHYRGANSERS